MIEDVDGYTTAMTVWADDYDKYQNVLKDGIPFKAVCKVNEYMETKDLSLEFLEKVYGRKL